MTDKYTDNDDGFAGLDALFDAARAAPAPLSEDMLNRLTRDALEVQAGFAASQVAPPRRGRLAGWLAAIGGWPAMATLATAGVAGLWIGAMPPAFVETLGLGSATASDTAEDDLYLVDPLPGFVVSLTMGEGS
ncbi:MAG: hypothetical protein VXW43_08705 [Pseudomonadota bacterium]|nr:hypothetical protein [Pseudomonadota bacterium]